MFSGAPSTDVPKVARKAWQLLPHDPAAIEQLSRTLRVAPIIAQLLLNRKIAEPSQARSCTFCTSPALGTSYAFGAVSPP